MARISLTCADWRSKQNVKPGETIQLDAVVIGSGYGGSVAALRLAEKGYRVTVLERGSEFQPGDFPNDLSQIPKYIRAPSVDGQSVSGRANGLFEWRVGPGVVSLIGNGLGGGSLINAGVAMRPDADVFTQDAWPTAIRFPEAASNGQPLQNYFSCAEDLLQAKPSPYPATTKTSMFGSLIGNIRLPDEKNFRATAEPVSVTIDHEECFKKQQCGDCATGCNFGAKQTLLKTYLKAACGAGATLVTGASVWTIAPVRMDESATEDGHSAVERWRLRVLDTASIVRWPRWADAAQEEGFDIEANFIVLAAGTFGSTELLQRSQDRATKAWWISPALGSRFSGNGDNLGFVVEKDKPVDAVGMGASVANTAPDVKVGPTITAHCDLRSSSKKPTLPLRHRLTIEDGAVPGAIERAFAEMVSTSQALGKLESWRTRSNVLKNASGEKLDPLAAGPNLARQSHILLVMGHDGSEGRIIYAPGRDASVPYWEQPEKLETYRVQEEILGDAARRRGAQWLPNPFWQLFPEAVTRVLSGPSAPRAITTVHPLGGCVMGDDPVMSVVDDVGRLWRSDRRQNFKTRKDWARHRNFLVLDGSIVPTALGVNPLLTITALAERAMAAVHSRRPAHGDLRAAAPAQRTGSCAEPGEPPQPETWQRPTQTEWSVSMRERLVCDSFALRGSMASAFGAKSAGGELALELEVDDWLRMWELAHHPLDRVRGTLRLQGGTADKPMVATYRVYETLRCELLAVSDYGQNLPAYLRWTACIGPWVRTAATYLIMRTDILANHELGQRRTLLEWLNDKLLPAIKQIAHLAEQRTMDYHLRLELDPGLDSADDLDALWTYRWRNNLARAGDLPNAIELTGTKRVAFPATWKELGRWLLKLCRRSISRSATHTQPPPRVRESFFDQASHLSVKVTDASGPLLEGRFLMDFAALLNDPPILLGDNGDLTGGLGAVAAYPGVITRFLLKTRLPDFRLPDYSQSPQAGLTLPEHLALRPAPPPDAPPPQRYVFKVDRGRSLGDSPDVNPEAKFDLVLWRYARPASENKLPRVNPTKWHEHDVTRVKSILLVHAFAQSGYTFTLNTLPVNLAGELYRAGFEVWILEHRLSTRLPIHEELSTLDQIAWYDLPEALEHIRLQLQQDFDNAEPGNSPVNLQIHAFAQCLGSASLAMSLLSGRLHYELQAPSPAGLPPQRCPMLASVMLSQTHPLCIGQPATQARTWIPAMLRNAFGQKTIPFGVRGQVDSIAESLLDRALAALPLPEEEQCPKSHSADGEDDCATCRRVRFIEAPLFKHRNLSLKTHRQLPLHFGKANVRTFAQSAKCVESERLVDEDGQSIYVTEETVRRFAGLPVAFLHGKENEVFHFESALQSAKLFAQVHPDYAQQAASALGPRRNANTNLPAWLVSEHGHYDVLIGEQAPQLVYPGIVEFFNSLQEATQAKSTESESVKVHATVRFPRVGPLIGPVQTSGELIAFRVSFMLDDRFSEGKRSEEGLPGTRCWAFARITSGSISRTYHLPIEQREISARSLVGRNPYRRRAPHGEPEVELSAYRFATRKIELNPDEWPCDTDLRIEAISVHETMAPDAPQYALSYEEKCWAAMAAPNHDQITLNRWLDKLIALSVQRVETLAADRLPLPQTVSRTRLKAEGPHIRFATVPAAARAAAIQDMSENNVGDVSFLASSCRYPGFPFDRHRADHAVQRVYDDPRRIRPAFMLLLGDQIYADATAGIVDSLNPVERFVERHRAAFSRSPRGTPASLGDLLAKMPVVMTPDDHEFINNYPAEAPLVMTRPDLMSNSQTVARVAAADAWKYFQSAWDGLGADGVMDFTAGAVRVLVLDTRSNRDVTTRRILSCLQRDRIKAWLEEEHAQTHLNVIATGSVLLPGLWANSDPANPGEPDNFQWSPADREWLLETLAKACSTHTFRFALLSGDYHLSTVCRLTLDKRAVGVAIVVPPMYAPMPYVNSLPYSINTSETVEIRTSEGQWTWEIESPIPGQPAPVWCGSAIAEITVRRDPGRTLGYEVTVSAALVDYEKGLDPATIDQQALEPATQKVCVTI